MTIFDFSELYRRMRKPLLQAASYGGATPEEAEDIFQDLMLWAWERWDQLPFHQTYDDAERYLRRAAVNRARKRVTRRNRLEELVEAVPEAITNSISVLDLLDLDRLLQVEPRLQEILDATYQGLPWSSTQRWWLHKNRSRLAEALRAKLR